MTPGEVVVAAALAALGLVMGSAVTSLSWRLPRGISWAGGRSRCPGCGAPLGPADLVPLFSFLFARGRCRHCGARISWRYPLTELACAAWAVLLFLRVGPTWAYVPLAFWGFGMVALFWTDLDAQILPDVLTLPGVALGVAATLLLRGPWPGILHVLFGVVAGSGLLGLLYVVWDRFLKREGLGLGDVKLAAMFGVVLGWQHTLLTLFLSSLAGSLWGLFLIARRRGGMRSALPFGALLAPAALAVFLWGDAWVAAYVGALLGR